MATQIDDYFADTLLAQREISGGNVILHTKTRKYVMGDLGEQESMLIYWGNSELIFRCDYATEGEYKQSVLERFEDVLKELEADGFMVDFDEDHL